MSLFKYLNWTLLAVSLYCTGCVSSGKYDAFTRTINFSGLDAFTINEVEVRGHDLKAPDVEELKTFSKDTLQAELVERGFREELMETDFYWVILWEKSATFSPNVTDSINGPRAALNKMDDPTGGFGVRWHLTLQTYSGEDGNLFWERKLPNLFEAIELREWRIRASIERAIENFPVRVEKDPNLPSIE